MCLSTATYMFILQNISSEGLICGTPMSHSHPRWHREAFQLSPRQILQIIQGPICLSRRSQPGTGAAHGCVIPYSSWSSCDAVARMVGNASSSTFNPKATCSLTQLTHVVLQRKRDVMWDCHLSSTAHFEPGMRQLGML